MLNTLGRALRDALGAALTAATMAWAVSCFAPRLNDPYRLPPAVMLGLLLWLFYAYFRVNRMYKALSLFGSPERVREILTLRADMLYDYYERESAIIRDLNRGHPGKQEENEERLNEVRKNIGRAEADFRRIASLARASRLIDAMPRSYKEHLSPNLRQLAS